MTKKYKLHCFRCGYLIKKGEVCRSRDDAHPICLNCLEDDIYDDFEFGEDYVFDEVINRFKGNYKKYWKWLEETHKICDQCNTWTLKENFIEDMNMCENCVEYLEGGNSRTKRTNWFRNVYRMIIQYCEDLVKKEEERSNGNKD